LVAAVINSRSSFDSAAAERMSAASGAAFAALSKELRELMTAATKGAATAVDPIDELKLRRDRKSG
jgi:hypothetical protein